MIYHTLIMFIMHMKLIMIYYYNDRSGGVRALVREPGAGLSRLPGPAVPVGVVLQAGARPNAKRGYYIQYYIEYTYYNIPYYNTIQ